MSNSFHHHLKVDFSSQAVSRPQQSAPVYFWIKQSKLCCDEKTTVVDPSIPRYTSN